MHAAILLTVLTISGCSLSRIAALIEGSTEPSGTSHNAQDEDSARVESFLTGDRSTRATPGKVSTWSGLDFVPIPTGSFVMGTDHLRVPLEAGVCETPAHTVVITEPFLLSRTEVTVGLFRQFVEDTGFVTECRANARGCNSLNLRTGEVQQLRETDWQNPGFPQTDDHPVVCVAHGDATAFCIWLSRQHGTTFRLPTEAEWEYACRAGTSTVFSSGKTAASLQGVANLGDESLHEQCPKSSGTAPWTDGFAFTAPVGTFRPNAFGLYDMHGNAGEWCSDWFDPAYYRISPSSDPTGPVQPRSWHVVRGGSWYNGPMSCRSSGRHDNVRTMASTTNGFRVVAELPPQQGLRP